MRRVVAVVAATVTLALVLSGTARAQSTSTSAPTLDTTTTVPPPPAPFDEGELTWPGGAAPKAWIVFDLDRGNVLSAGNAHERLRVASTIKLLTALIAHDRLWPTSPVGVSPHAAGMPARKINMKPGQIWVADDVLKTLLLVSANDAAVALAEQIGGSPDGFASIMRATGRSLQLADRPFLVDPAGLDDEFSHKGGNLISARDLAIVGRAFMDVPPLVAMGRLPDYRFTGGDALPHHIHNHVRFLKAYPGAIGGKTGYTKRAGHSLVAAAERDGRRLGAVVIGGPDTAGQASMLLDRGFASPARFSTGDRLPTGTLRPPPRATGTVGAASAPRTEVAGASTGSARLRSWTPAAYAVLAVELLMGLALYARIRRLRRRARRARARLAALSPAPPPRRHRRTRSRRARHRIPAG